MEAPRATVTILTENTDIREVIDTRILYCENYLGLGNWFIGSQLENFVTMSGFIVDDIVRAIYLTRKNLGFFEYWEIIEFFYYAPVSTIVDLMKKVNTKLLNT